MSKLFQFKCDKCKRRTKATYNGEHWLYPEGWTQLYCINKARALDIHLCEKCSPKPPKESEEA